MTRLDDASTKHLRASGILSFSGAGAGAGSESVGRGLGFGIGLSVTCGAGGVTTGGSTVVALAAHS